MRLDIVRMVHPEVAIVARGQTGAAGKGHVITYSVPTGGENDKDTTYDLTMIFKGLQFEKHKS